MKSIERIIEIPLSELQTEMGHRKNSKGNNPCLICGKEIKKGSKHKYVHLLENGNIVSYSESDIEGSQGLFPVGLECAKKLVIHFSF
jgi:hypothetical protein